MMRIILNGETREIEDGATLRRLVEDLAYASERIAVEHNREVRPRATWEAILLREGDRIEIVHFVGGGGWL